MECKYCGKAIDYNHGKSHIPMCKSCFQKENIERIIKDKKSTSRKITAIFCISILLAYYIYLYIDYKKEILKNTRALLRENKLSGIEISDVSYSLLAPVSRESKTTLVLNKNGRLIDVRVETLGNYLLPGISLIKINEEDSFKLRYY